MHTPGSVRGQVETTELWPEQGGLPRGMWIGWKFILYNLPEGSGVKLEAYRDLTGGKEGGFWELVSQVSDQGGWFTPTDCAEHLPVDGQSDQVILTGGVCFVRNTGVEEARYRWFSVREVTASAAP